MKFDVADIILFNGTIRTMDPQERICRAVAVKDGKIAALSQDSYPAAWRGFRTELLDLEGMTLLPGFIDCNVHSIYTSLIPYCIHADTNKKDELLRQLSETVKHYSQDELVWCVGYEGGENEKPLSRWELDQISSIHPIIVSRAEFHATVVNTTAYNLLGIPAGINGIQRDGQGMPTGVLKGEASGFARRKVHEKFIDRTMREKALRQTMKKAAACGITTMNAMEGGSFFNENDMITVSDARTDLEAELLLFPQIMDIAKAKKLARGRIGGNLYVDGTLGSKTAALESPYEQEPDNKGILYYKQDEITRFLLSAQENNMQIALSCIGERAIDMLLDSFAFLSQVHDIRRLRHRLELFVLPTGQQIQRAADLGLIFSMRPYYDRIWGGKEGAYSRHIGARWQRTNPIGTIIAAGGMVCGGSESPVTPLSPLLGIHSAVNHNNPEHRTSITDALKMYTCNAAYANFAEHRIGSIQPGMDADFVLLNQDPVDTPAGDLESIQVVKTLKKGIPTYGWK